MRKDANMVKRINYTKARLLYPFARRYRVRASIAYAPEAIRIIAPYITVTNDHKLIFVKNSKAGCSTVAHALYYYNYGDTYTGRIHHSHIGLIQGGDFAPEGVRALTSEHGYKFTFVRDPTARIISAFHNFVLEKTNSSAQDHLKHLPAFGYRPNNSAKANFDALLSYIEYCFSISKDYTNPHFRLQTLNTAYDVVGYSHIAKIEQYSQEMQFILEDAGVWNEQHSAVLQIKANTSKGVRYIPSSEQLHRIEAIYADDYETFGYPRPSRS